MLTLNLRGEKELMNLIAKKQKIEGNQPEEIKDNFFSRRRSTIQNSTRRVFKTLQGTELATDLPDFNCE